MSSLKHHSPVVVFEGEKCHVTHWVTVWGELGTKMKKQEMKEDTVWQEDSDGSLRSRMQKEVGSTRSAEKERVQKVQSKKEQQNQVIKDCLQVKQSRKMV